MPQGNGFKEGLVLTHFDYEETGLVLISLFSERWHLTDFMNNLICATGNLYNTFSAIFQCFIFYHYEGIPICATVYFCPFSTLLIITGTCSCILGEFLKYPYSGTVGVTSHRTLNINSKQLLLYVEEIFCLKHILNVCVVKH